METGVGRVIVLQAWSAWLLLWLPPLRPSPSHSRLPAFISPTRASLASRKKHQEVTTSLLSISLFLARKSQMDIWYLNTRATHRRGPLTLVFPVSAEWSRAVFLEMQFLSFRRPRSFRSSISTPDSTGWSAGIGGPLPEVSGGLAAAKVASGTSAARLLGLHSAAQRSMSRLPSPLHHSLFSARYIPCVLCLSASQAVYFEFLQVPHGDPTSLPLTQGLPAWLLSVNCFNPQVFPGSNFFLEKWSDSPTPPFTSELTRDSSPALFCCCCC